MRIVPLLLAAAVGLIVVDGGFVYDDPTLLVENPVVNGRVPVSEAFTRDFWGRDSGQGFITWRPLMPVIWAQLWALWPSNPLPFRMLGVLLHVLAVGLSMRFVRKLSGSAAQAAAVGALFAVHPLNTEAVSAIAAQADVLSFALVLVACVVALGRRTWTIGAICASLLLVAALVKESAVIFAPLVGLLFALRPGVTVAKWRATLPVALVTFAVVAFQLSLRRAAGVEMITSNLAHSAHGSTRLLLGLHNAGRALAMTVWPHPIAPNHGYAAVELRAPELVPWASIGGVLLAGGCIALLWSIRSRRLGWVAALCFLYAPAVLQTHWLVRLVTDLAERLLYPSTLGVSMLATVVLFRLAEQSNVRAGIVAAACILSLVVSSSARRAWTDEDALWLHAVRVEPRAALHHHNVSNTHFRNEDLHRGAYHRLLYVYLIDRFPEPVLWDAIAELDRMPADARTSAMPEALEPSNPCALIATFLAEARRYEPLHEYVVRRWSTAYPQCVSAYLH